jgi:glycosyltransferase involved in cell wall biosynthesis
MIIPVKKEEGDIENCVMSCLNSICPKKEMIIANDGSTDNTLPYLGAFTAKTI